jgi:hypothetical protein
MTRSSVVRSRLPLIAVSLELDPRTAMPIKKGVFDVVRGGPHIHNAIQEEFQGCTE